MKITRASSLWIEADPVFGGSLSQIQFPVELSGFFALDSDPDIGDSTQIAVTVGGVDFPHKKMDFHHNQMWRLNLPTPRQGLGGYRGKILLFEKTAKKSRFRLWLVEPGSPFTRKLRSTSRSRGTLGSTLREDRSSRRFRYF